MGFIERWKHFFSLGNSYDKLQLNLFEKKKEKQQKIEDSENYHLLMFT